MFLFKEIQTLDENIEEEIKKFELDSEIKSESSTNYDEIFAIIESNSLEKDI